MNKVMALLFLIAALGCFGLSQRDSFQTQNTTRFGSPVGEVRTVHITHADRIAFITVGLVCIVGCLFFVARIRNDDSRR